MEFAKVAHAAELERILTYTLGACGCYFPCGSAKCITRLSAHKQPTTCYRYEVAEAENSLENYFGLREPAQIDLC